MMKYNGLMIVALGFCFCRIVNVSIDNILKYN